jgi:hypothetical protein
VRGPTNRATHSSAQEAPQAVLGPVALLAIPLVAREQARVVGFELEVNDTELAVLRLRVAKRAIDFGELRGCFSARLRPLDRS